jgi:hypothetical protein
MPSAGWFANHEDPSDELYAPVGNAQVEQLLRREQVR